MTLSISGEIAGLALEYNLYITGRSSAYLLHFWKLLQVIKSGLIFWKISNQIFSSSPIQILWRLWGWNITVYMLEVSAADFWPDSRPHPYARMTRVHFCRLFGCCLENYILGTYLPESRAVQWNVTILYGFGETAKWAKFKHFKVFAGVHVVGVYEVTCVWYYSLVEYCRCWSKVWAVRRNGSVHSPDSLDLWVTSSPWLSLVRLCTRTSVSPLPHRVFHSSI